MKTLVLAGCHEEWSKKLEKLNRKLAKYNSSVEVLSKKKVTVPVTRVFSDGDTHKLGDSEAYEYELSEPSIRGKKGVIYLGKITWKEGTPLVETLRENNLEETFSPYMTNQTFACNHCNTVRKRSKYYFFEEAGEVKVVGSSCVQEYMGLDIEGILYASNIFFQKLETELEEQFMRMRFGGSPDLFEFSSVVSALEEITENYSKPWEPRTFQEEGTAHYIRNRLMCSSSPLPQKTSYQEEVEKIKSLWLNAELNSSFLLNIHASLFEGGEVRSLLANRTLGISCWAIYRAMTYKPPKEKNPESAPSEYQGEEGKRGTFKATVIVRKVIETFYGISTLYVFRNETGKLVWFSSSNEELELETEYQITGRVKEHREYKGERQTVLTRCKVEELVG